MSFFERIKTLTVDAPTLARSDMEANISYGLPFLGINSTWVGADYSAKQVADDCYEVTVNPYSPPVWVDAQTMKKIVEGFSVPHIGLFRQTAEEEERLRELEDELKAWKKQKRLDMFKALPPDVRQSIVSESFIRDLQDNYAYQDEADFPDIDELNSLKSSIFDTGMKYSNMNSFTYDFKFWPILNDFSTQELLQAHADISLEEEIAE